MSRRDVSVGLRFISVGVFLCGGHGFGGFWSGRIGVFEWFWGMEAGKMAEKKAENREVFCSFQKNIYLCSPFR